MMQVQLVDSGAACFRRPLHVRTCSPDASLHGIPEHSPAIPSSFPLSPLFVLLLALIFVPLLLIVVHLCR